MDPITLLLIAVFVGVIIASRLVVRDGRYRHPVLAASAAGAATLLGLTVGIVPVAACSQPPDPNIEELGPQQVVLLGRIGDPVPGGRAFHVERWFNATGPAVVTIAFKEGEPIGDCSYRVTAGTPLVIAPVMEPGGRLSADLGTLQASPLSPEGVAYVEEANRLFGPGSPPVGGPVDAGGRTEQRQGMDPITLIILAIVITATVAWLVMRRRADAALTPEERLEQATLKAEQDRQRTSAIEHADRYNVNGPPNP